MTLQSSTTKNFNSRTNASDGDKSQKKRNLQPNQNTSSKFEDTESLF